MLRNFWICPLVSRNIFSFKQEVCWMDLKIHPTIQHTNMKHDAKHQEAFMYNNFYAPLYLHVQIHFPDKQEVYVKWNSKQIPQLN